MASKITRTVNRYDEFQREVIGHVLTQIEAAMPEISERTEKALKRKSKVRTGRMKNGWRVAPRGIKGRQQRTVAVNQAGDAFYFKWQPGLSNREIRKLVANISRRTLPRYLPSGRSTIRYR